MLENLSRRVKNLEIDLKFDPSVKSALAEKGFDAVYGARPLRREIQNKIEDTFSEKLLAQEFKKGDSVLCCFADGEFIFKKGEV